MIKPMKRNDVIQMQFYQMPKAFFHNPTYKPMKCESKLAYMLILDLLPLSIKNNWVNEKGEVFVRLSRTKLMDLLNIRGSQKAAQVMKELVDYNLIIYKRVGLSKCNEIYLFHPEGPERKGPGPKRHEHQEQNHEGEEPKDQEPMDQEPMDQEPMNQAPDSNQAQKKPQQTQLLEALKPYVTPPITTPLSPTERLNQDIAEIHDLLENHIHMEDLRQKYDPQFVDEIGNNICEMFLSPSTRIGQQDKPLVIMRGVIRKLKMHHIEHVIDQFKEVARRVEIFNPKRYIQTMIYNSIYEAQTKVLGHIKYNFGY